MKTIRSRINIRTWDDGGDISHFTYLHPSEIFPSAIVKRAGEVRELPECLRSEIGRFVVDSQSQQTLSQFCEVNPVDGFIIVHKGEVVFEEYPRMQPDDRHLIFSVTKAFVGTVISLLEDREQLSLQQPVDQILPELQGTAWRGVTLRDVSDMASGMEGSEDNLAAYTDPKHKHFQMEAALGWQPRSTNMPASVRSGEVYRFVHSLRQEKAPGQEWVYTSANTLLLGETIERVTGKRLADVISNTIWRRVGAQGWAISAQQAGVPYCPWRTRDDTARSGPFRNVVHPR